MSDDDTAEAEAGYDSVADALEEAGGPAGGGILQRTIREANGQPAYPTPTDYIAAVQATDGAVAIELGNADADIVRLDDPDDRRFRVSGSDDEISTPILAAMIDEYGADLVLYEDFAQFFDDVDADTDAQRIRSVSTHEQEAA